MKKMIALFLAAAMAWLGSMTVLAEGETAEPATEAEITSEQVDALADPIDVATQIHYLAAPKVYKQAEQVKLTLTAQNRDGNFEAVTDEKDATFSVAWYDLKLSFKGSQAFTRLYFKVEMPCEWTVVLPDGSKITCGKTGFIHEVTELGQAVYSFDVILPKGVRLCDVYAFTDGQLPDWVQQWEPICDKADLLVLPSHADDEHLWFGGVMPYYAGELGYEVQVVYMTNHFDRTLRCHEILNGLWTVGVRHYPYINEAFPDAMRTRYDRSYAIRSFGGYKNIVGFQVEILRRFAPKVVVGHDIKGEYGHKVHILNAETLLEALELTDDPNAYPDSAAQYGTCKIQKCYLHLWNENRLVMEWGQMPLKRFGDKTALKLAELGFKCHYSQQGYAFAVRDSGSNDCRKFGLAYTTVGKDTPDQNDMFEHTDMWTRP